MKISETFSGSYFKAADFTTPRTFVIESVAEATFDEGSKPAIKFRGETQQLVLNRTNAFTMAHALGDDTDSWRGHQIQVFSVPTFFQGKQVKGICVQPLGQPGGAHGQFPTVADQTSQIAASQNPATPPSPQPVAQQLPPSHIPAPQQSTPRTDPRVQAPNIDYSE